MLIYFQDVDQEREGAAIIEAASKWLLFKRRSVKLMQNLKVGISSLGYYCI